MKRLFRSRKAWCWALFATLLVVSTPNLATPQEGRLKRWLHKLRPHSRVARSEATSAETDTARPVVLAEQIQPPPTAETQPPPSAETQAPPSEVPLQPPPAAGQTVPVSLTTNAQDLLQRLNESNVGSRPTGGVSGGEAQPRAARDAGDFIGKTPSIVSVRTQKRTPVSNDPQLRGYHVGQLVTQSDGAFWFPARQDMDTMLSKIDSGIIRDVLVINGPYSTRYGPGFSFIDISTTPTPRYQNGFDWGGRTLLNYQTNGEQWYGRETLWGGSADWGFRVGYGLRSGNDYESGNGTDMPSSYHTGDLDSAFGMDLSPDSRIQVGYLRLDEHDTEFPGEVFDVNWLVTDAFNLHYELENQPRFDLLTVDTWYNRTRFEGNAQGSGKHKQIPELNPPPPNRQRSRFGFLNFTGFTDVDEASTGFSTAATWGLPQEPQLTVGVDFRYLKQQLNEFDTFDGAPPVNAVDTNFPIPRSHSSNPGMFVEHILPVGDRLTLSSGMRVDWVSTNAASHAPGRTDDLRDTLGTDTFDKHFGMWSGFVTAEYELSDCWSLLGGAGHAERAPTPTELYAVDPFLAILQQGFTQVRGNPNLRTERLWQLDLGLRTEYSRFRGGISGFYSWVINYITYEVRNNDLQQAGISNGLAVNFVNTDLATLSGGELYGEFDLTSYLTPFATLSYVEGRDHSRDNRGILPGSREEPLPMISPLESRLGIRLHEAVCEPDENPGWGVELSARMVDEQDRVASSLLEQQTGGFTVWDLRGYLQARENLLLVAGVENFGDRNYREHLDLLTGHGVLRPGINFYFGGELTY